MTATIVIVKNDVLKRKLITIPIIFWRNNKAGFFPFSGQMNEYRKNKQWILPVLGKSE
jgi:hypothetical protein